MATAWSPAAVLIMAHAYAIAPIMRKVQAAPILMHSVLMHRNLAECLCRHVCYCYVYRVLQSLLKGQVQLYVVLHLSVPPDPFLL